jgi:uncharacterized protein
MSSSVTAVRLLPDRLDVDRLRCQERGESVLVMDRVSGRWIALDREWAELLPLLRNWGAAGPFREATRRLRQTLIAQGVGVVGTERHFKSLNTLIIKLTPRCNHACQYCYDYESSGGSAIGEDVAVESIRQALTVCEERLQVILHGGEPFLVWPLVERIVAAGERIAAGTRKTLRFVGQTNLSRLSTRIRDFSLEHDIVWGVSVDGPPDIHDRFRTYRSGAGTYADFARSLARFPRFVRSCGVLSTVTSANDGDLLTVGRHFRDLEMASWDWSLFQPIGRGRLEAELFSVNPDRLVGSWHQLFDAVLRGEFDGFPVRPILKYVENFRHGPGANMCMRPECGAGRDLLSISAGGTIEACDCIDTRGPLAGLGHIDVDSLEAARNSPTAHMIRARDLTATRCGDCIWWGVCGGGCMARASARDAIPDIECAVALAAFDRIADELVRAGVTDGGKRPVGRLERYLNSLPEDASQP